MHYFYSLPNIIRSVKWRRMRQVGHVACMGEERHAYEVFEGGVLNEVNCKEDSWNDDIKLVVKEIRCEGDVSV